MLREAIEQDVATIRSWRNHPKVRGASIWTAYITPEAHLEWWARVRSDPAKLALIFTYEDLPCGVVTFNDIDRTTGSAEWGFFLDVDGLTERQTLLPAWLALEAEAVDYAFEELGLERIGGRTLAWNRQVLELHRRFRFVEVPERGYVATIEDKDEAVVWTELTVDRWRAASRRSEP